MLVSKVQNYKGIWIIASKKVRFFSKNFVENYYIVLENVVNLRFAYVRAYAHAYF